MSFFRKEKKTDRYIYNVIATKKTKQYLLAFKLKNGSNWKTTLKSKTAVKCFLEELRDKDINILEFKEDTEPCQFFLNKDVICSGDYAPKMISISEWFDDAVEAYSFQFILLGEGWSAKQFYGNHELEVIDG